ncbi:universal stress protein [Haliea sp. E1-2-M8]|uniref:universal stress protein n=1 Tax=Haliea sp. E1-2-M8 TaxID=3064706 RepID=UPI0027260742|nr:universal stress protein [Haliea sp. E1-2-M8]MDO8861043.1 universal stress protein [Haliea sp. E1-2-M8]
MSTVTACIDASPSAPCVATASAWASQRLQAPLLLLHVLERPEAPPTQDLSGSIGLGSREQLLAELTELDARRERLAMEHGKHLLEDAARLAAAAGVESLEKRQRHGSLLETLREMEGDTRLLVMGRVGEDHDIAAHTIGSHLESVVRSVHRPIMVVMREFVAPRQFMIAYDGSPTASKALDLVASSPLLTGLPCHLVTVGPLSAEQTRQIGQARDSLVEAGFEVITATVEGEVQAALGQYHRDNDIDLMVMGAWGHSRIRQFFVGSNTTRMLSHSDITLLLLR